ncbi:MAG: hypothetical protein DRJ60_03070 [Thermoprotei archaeon]|nr:MAG: hypothetical protein DRJ60_03070 [Thermoprotei archaeon]
MIEKIELRQLAGAIAFSLLLSVSLFYLTLEVPRALDFLLRNFYPDLFFDVEAAREMIEMLRPYALLALAATALLIVIGFFMKRGFLSFLGAFSIYIPVFGYFAFAMFFLAGIGILRALWIPIMDLSPDVLKLGHVVLLPFIALSALLPSPMDSVVIMTITLIVMYLGLLIFSLGVATWLYGKFRGFKLIDFWIYRYSRHPQYLGYIMWSYGLLTYTCVMPYVRGALAIPPSFPWLISTMIVIGVALIEEMKMKIEMGERYLNYCKKTPFMLPLPRPLSRALSMPLRLSSKVLHGGKRSVALTLLIYIVLLMVLSFLVVSLLKL